MEISAFAFLLFDLAKEQATSNQEITYFHLQSAGMDVAMITTHSNYLSSFVSFYYFLCHLFFRSSQDLFLYIVSDVSMNKICLQRNDVNISRAESWSLCQAC